MILPSLPVKVSNESCFAMIANLMRGKNTTTLKKESDDDIRDYLRLIWSILKNVQEE